MEIEGAEGVNVSSKMVAAYRLLENAVVST
jgi:hypothetical protein